MAMGDPMTAAFPVRACPFCGVATDVPHETQEGCIEALQAEIDRMRGILRHVKGPGLGLENEGKPDLA
jgi:hypothetical protein